MGTVTNIYSRCPECGEKLRPFRDAYSGFIGWDTCLCAVEAGTVCDEIETFFGDFEKSIGRAESHLDKVDELMEMYEDLDPGPGAA